MGPHDEFLELCAVSTTGELTADEQAKLHAHLAGCPECREALQQYEAVTDRAVPALAPELAREADESAPSASDVGVPKGTPEAAFFERLAQEENAGSGHPVHHPAQEFPPNDPRTKRFRSKLARYEFWLPYAAGILLCVTLGVFVFRGGLGHRPETAQAGQGSDATAKQVARTELDTAVREREVADAKLAERDKAIAELHRQMTQQTVELSRLKAQFGDVESAAQATEGEKNRIAQERDSLAQKAHSDEVSLQRIQKDLDTLQQERSKDVLHSATLEAKVADLSRLIGDRERTVDQQQTLLEHDRDIRELMGARDLYIAEVYDVAKTGETQKSFGRIFLTKGKSLIFYAYDLDQQPGLRKGSTFQAWGQRGPDRAQALNLGIFYQDNVAKKRWVVKSEDPKTLEQIDAVFVTVEPKGGSNRPSGKPLLFAYLRIDSNHP
jgi:hypothetical protein